MSANMATTTTQTCSANDYTYFKELSNVAFSVACRYVKNSCMQDDTAKIINTKKLPA
ncbi:Hypothetical predicted protein [Lynx pardinus]|uniref:Uncharacterized protein n=1 Tax=Lynx pardinus TaxID=191816 RepID=A0A485NCF9_LYNPA|nr:Hypothetical predicted protein [Lynx pardinus]